MVEGLLSRPGTKAALLCAVAAANLAVLFAGIGAAADEEYELRVPASSKVPLGAESSLSLTIAPRPGHTISKDGPLVIELAVDPAKGLAPRKKRYRRKDAADARAEAPRFDLALRAETPGSYDIALAIRFWVCARRTCRPVKEKRAVKVEVPSPPPDAGPPPRGG